MYDVCSRCRSTEQPLVVAVLDSVFQMRQGRSTVNVSVTLMSGFDIKCPCAKHTYICKRTISVSIIYKLRRLNFSCENLSVAKFANSVNHVKLHCSPADSLNGMY